MLNSRTLCNIPKQVCRDEKYILRTLISTVNLISIFVHRDTNEFRIRVELQSLFRSPTIAGMTVILIQNMADEAKSEDIEQLLAELEGMDKF